ncbi:hypothetical protein [Winogradskyella sp. PG-2]|uniref:hypothetical protein n=1 Tax=Winogradskyella sp. PG-2 TaxID=754409 RepID=UPI000458872D|nr:hypothetical protein [Winogradskyella sp. PG-2]BAO77311.1 hypothetical protein WPG_3081 [Winogradskyella sp. PG-2]
MMKHIIIIITLFYTVVLFGQEHEELYMLNADSTWLKEVIKFPLSFAQDINYEGYEDLRFAKNWSKPEGTEFFTYAFVWNINLKDMPTIEMIETNMKLYYDGLMEAVNKERGFVVPKTQVEFKKLENKSESPGFRGKMKVHDSFFTREIIDLYVTIETSYCSEQDKYLMFFRISSLDFKNEIWNELNTISLASDICNK